MKSFRIKPKTLIKERTSSKMMTTIIKNILTYLIVLICGITFYSHKFVTTYSNEYYKLKDTHSKLKKERNLAYGDLKKSPQNSKLVFKYIEAKDRADKVWLKFKQERSILKFMGFKTFHHFLAHFGITFLILVYSLFNLFRSFYYERKNISSRFFHTFVLSIGMFNLFWAFNTFQDFSNFSYFLATIFSAVFVTIGFYLFTKYNKTTIQKLEESNQEAQSTIEQLEKEVLTKQEEEREKERQRISEELHDGVLGKLFGTRMGLGFLDLSNNQCKEKYQQFLNELQDVEKEIREVSHKLSANLDGSDIGFIGVIEQLLKDKSIINYFSYSLDVDKSINWKSINEVDRVNLYRILQEALQNIIKHAKAKNIEVTITKQDKTIRAAIKDDGIGFDSSKRKNGIGIKNIKSRVKRLKGAIQIHSKPNQGTALYIDFPYVIKNSEINQN